MRRNKTLKRCYLLLGAGWLLLVAYFLVITLPLMIKEREINGELMIAVERLSAEGHGMNSGEVVANIERIQKDIASLSKIGGETSRIIQLSDELESMLERPFQLLDFDHTKFLLIDRIRNLSRENKVVLFEGWERRLPVPGPGLEPPHLLWTQLGVIDQLIRSAILAGVDRIDEVRLVPATRISGDAVSEGQNLEVAVRMQLTGKMEAIHSVIMMLPLNADELQELELAEFGEPKSSFFLNRIILRKNSTGNPDEVSLDFVASGFLNTPSEP